MGQKKIPGPKSPVEVFLVIGIGGLRPRSLLKVPGVLRTQTQILQTGALDAPPDRGPVKFADGEANWQGRGDPLQHTLRSVMRNRRAAGLTRAS